MHCADVDHRELAERYLAGTLEDPEREAFEEHFFGCARCYSELEALRSIRDALARTPRRRRVVPPWMGLAAALVLATAALLAWYGLRTPTASPAPVTTVQTAPPARPDPREIAVLAAVEPPPYNTARFRGAGDRATFADGMRRYAKRDFTGAIPLLVRALREQPSAEDARFYLGASYLLDERGRDAIAMLEPVAARGESSYAEEAQFLIAKAQLRAGDLAAAREALDRTIAMKGERREAALFIRQRLAALAQPGR